MKKAKTWKVLKIFAQKYSNNDLGLTLTNFARSNLLSGLSYGKIWVQKLINTVKLINESECMKFFTQYRSRSFLAHLSLLRMSFWDTGMSVVRRTCGPP